MDLKLFRKRIRDYGVEDFNYGELLECPKEDHPEIFRILLYFAFLTINYLGILENLDKFSCLKKRDALNLIKVLKENFNSQIEPHLDCERIIKNIISTKLP